ncbi:MAG: flagellar hook protein FlgE [Firmicutes bacterium]|jgi:flagellar hook protein FlgE|nr:flagellar hook protein FlgE [Bacillota bacterium]MDD4336677.1 flagellar hook protein FlgE [Bacillota bacterium]MDD4792822.1 flagellar hook protein FlgE [Bacillota bacterium]
MMRSMFAGVSGTRAHQLRMDVIGNNIANVNTVGYKYGRATFQDMLSQTIRGSMAPTGTRGGVDPMQVGLGVATRSIDIVFTPGNLEYTGRLTDMAIRGNGLFVVRDSGGALQFTRDGAFNIDAEGSLTHPSTGFLVQGWMADASGVIDRSKEIDGLTIPLGTSMSAKATDRITFVGNLQAGSAAGESHTTSVPVYDSQGLQHTVAVEFVKTGADNEWEWTATGPSGPAGSGIVKFDANGAVSRLYRPTSMAGFSGNLDSGAAVDTTITKSVQVYDSQGQQRSLVVKYTKTSANEWSWEATLDGESESVGSGILEFDGETGMIIGGSTGQVEIDSETSVSLSFSDIRQSGNPSSVTGEQDGIPVGSISILPGTGAAPINITPNFKSITQVGDASSVNWSTQDGYAAGTMETFNIDDNGVITGVYSNGQYKIIGQMALASFANAEGLARQANNMFAATTNSGSPQIGAAAAGGRGSVMGTTLEMSNVDLAREFTDMIITQRGFQANSRVITAADEMLQELLALKR